MCSSVMLNIRTFVSVFSQFSFFLFSLFGGVDADFYCVFLYSLYPSSLLRSYQKWRWRTVCKKRVRTFNPDQVILAKFCSCLSQSVRTQWGPQRSPSSIGDVFTITNTNRNKGEKLLKSAELPKILPVFLTKIRPYFVLNHEHKIVKFTFSCVTWMFFKNVSTLHNRKKKSAF